MRKFIVGVVFIFGSLSNAFAGDTRNGIGYETVELALKALKNDTSAVFSVHEDWIVVTQSSVGKYVLWSFTPINHPAHPSAVRREVIEKGGQIHLGMDVLCQEEKLNCDQLVEEFKELNKKIIGE